MKYIAAFERRAEARGEERGIELGKGRILSKLLKLKFGTLPEWVSKKMEGAKADQLELWSERILTTQTPEEVFEV